MAVMIPDPLTFAQQALGCRFASQLGPMCATHAADSWPCPEATRLAALIEALAAEMQSDTCPACHASYADEGSTTWGCDHTEGMQHAGDMLRALLAEGGE